MVDGTTIENTGATTDSGNRYEVCMRTGKKAKRGTLVKDGYGIWCLPEYADRKHPSDFSRARGADQPSRGALNPDDTGREIFISTAITTDDL